jgi:hypothetical protein
MKRDEEGVAHRLAGLHDRVKRIATAEDRASLVAGWRVEGHALPDKERLIDDVEALLDRLIG